jgi:hypothetical protein
LLIGYPRHKESEPILGGFGYLHPNARRSVNGRRDSHHKRGRFDWSAIGTVSAKVQTLAAVHLLVQMKECA